MIVSFQRLYGVLRWPSTGLKVLIVVGGPAGLLTALECWKKGHDVEVVEKNSKNSTIGDVIFIGSSALATFKDYPSMLEEYHRQSWDAFCSYRRLDGEEVCPPQEFEYNRDDVQPHVAWPLRIRTMVSRPGMSIMFYEQCMRLGIPVKFGVNVVDYVENAAEGTATAVTADGQELTADIVVAADGLGTKSHKVVMGEAIRAVPTDLSFAASSIDDGTVSESWAETITGDEFVSKLPVTEGWDPLILEGIRNIPENSIVKWQLCWRDPQPKWTSPEGRILQLGDSAHAFIPSSISGASTALEDAQSLAECLRLAGKKDANIGTKVHELLRIRRASTLQRLGFANRREMHRKGGFEEVMKSAAKGGPMGLGKWIWTHDPAKYATDKFAEGRSHLENGTPFEHTNLPKGFKWEPNWTMQGEIEIEKQGIHTPDLKMNGDWSIY
ncbi:hypothetical protein BDP81DRAFT_464608 [Colletotrichum phormii]|uniref:FAD-dependent monooxygenase mdpD n=1 Tax=Colletotrichum phormii TaxID=359342 RepID=A0AAI9ZH27_9PEZI|nr:uncharacterized protein BDP81DRAFT_464608 [Colletotrichum phormii]KAK1624454.1 hypothetical protein BDP81DRAFT_464608 [Colletotrichum phormii]